MQPLERCMVARSGKRAAPSLYACAAEPIPTAALLCSLSESCSFGVEKCWSALHAHMHARTSLCNIYLHEGTRPATRRCPCTTMPALTAMTRSHRTASAASMPRRLRAPTVPRAWQRRSTTPGAYRCAETFGARASTTSASVRTARCCVKDAYACWLADRVGSSSVALVSAETHACFCTDACFACTLRTL